MVTILPTIVLGKQPRQLPTALRILTSKKTTAVLGATLAGLLFAPAATFGLVRGAVRLVTPKTLPQALLIPSAAVILKESPTARKTLKGVLKGDPGRAAAGLIEKAPTAAKKTAEKGGLLGLGAAVVAGLGIGAVATKKGREIVSNVGAVVAKIPKPSFPKKKETAQEPPTGLLPAPPSITPTTQPLGAVQQPVEAVPVVVKEAKPMQIKNTFNPTIDIRFSKSKRFINQQINVRR